MADREPQAPSRNAMGLEAFREHNLFAIRLNEGSRKVRPSHFQKAVKSYDGSGDAHNHLARVRQYARAENVRDLHTLVEVFGLTLEGQGVAMVSIKKS